MRINVLTFIEVFICLCSFTVMRGKMRENANIAVIFEQFPFLLVLENISGALDGFGWTGSIGKYLC